jgi:beta-glucosidase
MRAQRTPAGARVSVRVKNDSSREGDEVVQLYVSGGGAPGDPIRTLRGFQRVHLRAGESRDVEFTLATIDLPKTRVRITIGGGQPTGKIPFAEATL